MGKYVCVVWSNSSRGREYEVDSQSAMKAADKFGRCEMGEVVCVARKRTREVLSKAMWEPAIGYCHVLVWKGEYV